MKKDKRNQEIIDSYDYLTHAAATQDCTGLIQTPPKTQDEVEAYEAVYPYLPPKLDESSKTEYPCKGK